MSGMLNKLLLEKYIRNNEFSRWFGGTVDYLFNPRTMKLGIIIKNDDIGKYTAIFTYEEFSQITFDEFIERLCHDYIATMIVQYHHYKETT